MKSSQVLGAISLVGLIGVFFFFDGCRQAPGDIGIKDLPSNVREDFERDIINRTFKYLNKHDLISQSHIFISGKFRIVEGIVERIEDDSDCSGVSSGKANVTKSFTVSLPANLVADHSSLEAQMYLFYDQTKRDFSNIKITINEKPPVESSSTQILESDYTWAYRDSMGVNIKIEAEFNVSDSEKLENKFTLVLDARDKFHNIVNDPIMGVIHEVFHETPEECNSLDRDSLTFYNCVNISDSHQSDHVVIIPLDICANN